MSLRQQVKGYIEKHPNASNNDLKDEFPDDNWNSVRPYANEFRKAGIKTVSSDISPKQKITKSNNKPPTNPPSFIDDPDELLMSVAVRELNKSNPDPRWANVLITTRKANIGQSTKEGKIRSRFKSMNIKDIAKILSEKPQGISQKQDLKESS